MESVRTGDQAELGHACIVTANTSLSLTQFELDFFFFSFLAVGIWLSVDYYSDHFAPGKALVIYK